MAPLEDEGVDRRKSVEELENEVEEGERRLRDIEIECEESVVSKGFSKVYIPNKNRI